MMNYIKCPKCGKEEPAFDYAHVCGPVQVKKSFNKRLRDFERESKLEIFGLGARRILWEAALTKYAELIIKECIKEAWAEIVDDEDIAAETDPQIREYLIGQNQGIVDAVIRFRNHFGIVEFDENQNTEKR